MNKPKFRFIYLFLIFSLCSVAFWIGTQVVPIFLTKVLQTKTSAPENPNHSALLAIARRGFVFEYDMKKSDLRQKKLETSQRNFETNLKMVLAYHHVERQMFNVTMQCSIAIPGGTSEQIEAYHQLIIEGELATSTLQRQTIEKKKKELLNGAKVAPIIQTNSTMVNKVNNIR